MPTRGSPSRRREKAPRGENLIIGAYLKHARLNRRRSLRQLSDEVGCSESFLSKVENDKLRPSLAMLHRIVSALGVSIGKLFVAGNGATRPLRLSRRTAVRSLKQDMFDRARALRSKRWCQHLSLSFSKQISIGLRPAAHRGG